jgi:hypothetical protein
LLLLLLCAPQDEEAPTNIIDEVLQRRKRAKKRDTDQEVTDEVMSLVSMVSTPAQHCALWLCRRPVAARSSCCVSCKSLRHSAACSGHSSCAICAVCCRRALHKYSLQLNGVCALL